MLEKLKKMFIDKYLKASTEERLKSIETRLLMIGVTELLLLFLILSK